MPGFTETLIIIAIILGIIVLPRRLGRQPERKSRSQMLVMKLNGWQRLAIFVSFLWLVFFVLYLRPWNNGWRVFFYAGVIPVVLYWGIFWIFLGFRKMSK